MPRGVQRAVGRVRILNIDPELGAGLDRSSFELARRRCTAELIVARRGSSWPAAVDAGAQANQIGFLVVQGTVLHRLRLAGRDAVELLGPGDFVRPWPAEDDMAELLNPSRWELLDDVEFAGLDSVFAEQARQWPELSVALSQRLERRLRSLMLRLAVARIRRLETRLRIVLWDLADRVGRVDREGVFVPVRLRQDVLGGLVSATRPAVGRALAELQQQGAVKRDRRGWRLAGDPPAELFSTLGAPLSAPPRAQPTPRL